MSWGPFTHKRVRGNGLIVKWAVDVFFKLYLSKGLKSCPITLYSFRCFTLGIRLKGGVALRYHMSDFEPVQMFPFASAPVNVWGSPVQPC